MTRAPAKSAARKGDAGTAENLLAFYRDMLLIRRFEERAGQLYGMGLVELSADGKVKVPH